MDEAVSDSVTSYVTVDNSRPMAYLTKVMYK
jgi:hypothetical protein